MSSEQTMIWKQAAKIFADVAELSVKKALHHLDEIENLDLDVKQAVITLINTGNQASVYIKKT